MTEMKYYIYLYCVNNNNIYFNIESIEMESKNKLSNPCAQTGHVNIQVILYCIGISQ